MVLKHHPGFAVSEQKIMKREGMSKKKAGAILAAGARNASAAARRSNPKLKKVKG